MLSAFFSLFLTGGAALAARHQFPAPQWYLVTAIHALFCRNCVMVDPHVLDGLFKPALCQLVGLIDDF
jgi:hypothetical protein